MPYYFDPQSGSESIPSNISTDELKRRHGIPSGRDIIKITPDSEYQRTSRVDSDEGIYVDVPQYKRGVNMARLRNDLINLDEFFGRRYQIHADSAGKHVTVYGLDLPYAYSPNTSNVLIMLPSDYPETPPGIRPSQGVYLTTGLSRHGTRLHCSNDYHENCSCMDSSTLSDMYRKGWAWWCFAKMSDWNPRRDGLVQIFMVLVETLQNPRS